MCVVSIKVPIRKKSGNLSNDPRTTAITFLSLKTPENSGIYIYCESGRERGSEIEREVTKVIRQLPIFPCGYFFFLLLSISFDQSSV